MNPRARAPVSCPRVKPSLPRYLGAGCLLAGLVISTAAGAQGIAAAEALFNRGLADMEAGRYDTGCKALAESQRLDPRAGTLFTLATCEARWGHIATAATRYGDYLALYDQLPPDRKAAQGERPKLVKAELAKLTPDIPQLTLSVVKTAPAGTVIKHDGEVVSEATLGVALPVDPGEHTFSIQAPGGAAQEQRVTIAKGEKKLLTLTLEARVAAVGPEPPLPQPLPGPSSSDPVRSHLGPIIAFGAAVVGLGVGIGAGVAVLGKRADLDKACPNFDCPLSEQSHLDGAKALSHVSTVGFVVAGVGAAVGTVLLVLPLRGADKPGKLGLGVGPGYARLEGTF
jgi:hypothetical protein